ncbi:MAG: PEGA domain-containing protein [Vicinamibacterales bacterium]|nr:PEGA domain-containing protein [Vicinamibacterales bacterium]
MHTSTQAVTVRSEPPGAKVFVGGVDTGRTTPALMRLKRSERETTLRVEHEGVRPATIELRRSVSGWVWANLMLGILAPGGLAADYLEGSLFKLSPDAVLIDFPVPATTAEAPSRPPVVTLSGVPPIRPGSTSWFYAALGRGDLRGGGRDLGCSYTDRNLRTGGALGASFLRGKHLISLRTAIQERGLRYGDWLFGTTRVRESVSDYGVLYGRALRGRAGLASASIGLGFVRGEFWCRGGGWLDEPLERGFVTVGLPMEVRLHPDALARFGLGIYGFGNLNPERSFASVALGLSIGLLR